MVWFPDRRCWAPVLFFTPCGNHNYFWLAASAARPVAIRRWSGHLHGGLSIGTVHSDQREWIRTKVVGGYCVQRYSRVPRGYMDWAGRSGSSRVRRSRDGSMCPHRQVEHLFLWPSRCSWVFVRCPNIHSQPDSPSLLVFYGCFTARRGRTLLRPCWVANLEEFRADGAGLMDEGFGRHCVLRRPDEPADRHHRANTGRDGDVLQISFRPSIKGNSWLGAHWPWAENVRLSPSLPRGFSSVPFHSVIPNEVRDL